MLKNADCITSSGILPMTETHGNHYDPLVAGSNPYKRVTEKCGSLY